MFYLLSVIKVQWVTILNISGLYSHIQKILSITVSLRPLRQERYMLHQSVCCRHIQSSVSQ